MVFGRVRRRVGGDPDHVELGIDTMPRLVRCEKSGVLRALTCPPFATDEPLMDAEEAQRRQVGHVANSRHTDYYGDFEEEKWKWRRDSDASRSVSDTIGDPLHEVECCWSPCPRCRL